jgi:hypothetical protein
VGAIRGLVVDEQLIVDLLDDELIGPSERKPNSRRRVSSALLG